MLDIILASSSPRRKQLLTELGLQYTVIPSGIEERLNPRLGPHAQARQLAMQKAEAVAQKITGKHVLIIAADSIVVLGQDQLGKPGNRDEASRMLKRLSGQVHAVVTGFTIYDTGTRKHKSKSVETKVFMRKLSDREIISYIKKVDVLDKAGSYAMQGLGAIFFEKIEGDYSNVVGLPLYELSKALRTFGIRLL